MTSTNARSRPTSGALLAALLALGASLGTGGLQAEPVAVRYTEGVVHGFLALRTLSGRKLADGDLVQVARGDRVTSRLTFHFRDGSFHQETAVFSQRGHFRLLRDHLVQKGPAFPHPMDVEIDAASGRTTVRTTDKDGKPEVATQRLDLAPDVANGLILTLLKNLPPDAPGVTFSMAAFAPKGRVVKLVVSRGGEASFTVGASRRTAREYVVKVEIGGIAGLIAPLLGKQPPDSHVWILGGEAPAFVRSEAPLYNGGPLWRIELASPVWP